MANVNVTYQDMQTAAKDLRKGQSDIETTLRALKRQVDALVTGGYVTDSSSKAFSGAYTEFDTGVTKVITGLEGMGAYLDAAARTFQQADQELAAALAR
ncbi:WXG100 family type VII secretion target [Motilibacter aurantiacus]|uniref:WXG100 family type VII secretion target n=1 Tax=Motilibacter aurantiacus TaxID=2714955 RepID=UPI00140AEC45|nr:WXG100 family type VII secretion target [Motilibacter aurantiacus]NHC46812.1 WXG100 family type VII secretion target [Motilibacter aurantiacus]